MPGFSFSFNDSLYIHFSSSFSSVAFPRESNGEVNVEDEVKAASAALIACRPLKTKISKLSPWRTDLLVHSRILGFMAQVATKQCVDRSNLKS